LFINELDEKVFTTEAKSVSARAVILIGLCSGRSCRPFRPVCREGVAVQV